MRNRTSSEETEDCQPRTSLRGTLADMSQENLVSLSGHRPPPAARMAPVHEGGGYKTWPAQAVQAQRDAAAGTRKKTKYVFHVKLQSSSEA